MYTLVRGVDPTPVVAYRAPQTMSNEDNLGHCTSTARVAARLEPLLARLLARIDTERRLRGRTPGTLRVSVRRRQYRDQGSKQMPLPLSLLLRREDDRLDVRACVRACMSMGTVLSLEQ